MAISEIMREFLIRIKYDVDKTSEKSFTEGMVKATEVIGGVGAAIEATAGAVIYGLDKMSEASEKFFFISQRTNASVSGLKAIGFAGEQMGIGADAAYAAVERLASFLRSSPLAGQSLQRFGVKVDNDPTKTLQSLGEAFARLPIATAKALAAVAGIDENTMLVMRRGMGEYMATYQAILKRVGVNEDQAAAAGHAFMVQMRTTTAWVKVFGDSVLEKVGGVAAKAIHTFTEAVARNFDRITRVTSVVIDWVLEAAMVIGRLAARGVEACASLVDAFMTLPPAIQHIAEAFALLALSLIEFDWPVVLVTALGAALLLLYDDWKTWQEGGKSLIDWSKWEKDYKYVLASIEDLKGSVIGLYNAFADLGRAIRDADTSLGGHLFDKSRIISDIHAIIDSVGDLAHAIAGIARLYTALLNRDWAGVLNAARDVLKAAGVKPHDDGIGMPGMENDDRNFWQRSMPTWLGGKAAPATPLSKQTKAQEGPAFQFWKSKGFTDAGAAAMVSMEQRESASDSTAVGDHGTAHGLFQWHHDRAARILDATGIDITTASAADQRKAMYLEMSMGLDKQSGAAYNYIKNNSDAKAATALATGMVERPGDIPGESAVRYGMASGVLARQAPGGGDVKIDQANHYHINGATDPKAVAAAVGAGQDTSNQRLVRHVVSALE
jgi:hypothetical protein